jgi:hypothetical protein
MCKKKKNSFFLIINDLHLHEIYTPYSMAIDTLHDKNLLQIIFLHVIPGRTWKKEGQFEKCR